MGDNQQEESSIKKLEKRLYGSRPIRAERERPKISPRSFDVQSGWGDEEDILIMEKKKDSQTPVLSTLLIVSAIFFLSAAGIFTYFFIGGSNNVSSDNIDLSISGPISVKGGSELPLQISIGNRNNTPLKFAQLIVEYPDGTQLPKSDSVVPGRFIKQLGVIQANSVDNETVKAVLFGAENSQQNIKVTLEYRTEGSNATFIKEKDYSAFLSSSPISLSFDLPTDTSSGKVLDMTIKVNSNSSDVLKDVILEVDYPSGFIFKDASPRPIYGNSLWELGDLAASSTRSIHLTGAMQGQDGEVKTFRASVGARASKDDNKVTIVYGSSLQSLAIKKPFVDLGIVLSGDSATTDYVAGSGDMIRGDIVWTNNLPVKILNGQLSVKINGETLNKTSVSAGKGFYQSSNGIITWDQLNGNFPQSIELGQTGSQSFSFAFLPLMSGGGSAFKNPSLTLEATFNGTRFTEGGGAASMVDNTVIRKIKLSSDLQLTSRAVYHDGPFTNSGPLPPMMDKETTYTILWSIANSSNDTKQVTVRAALPSYIRWVGNISPSSGENITYNPLGGGIIWNVGDIPAGSGVTSQAREVAFQIGLTPSISQIGQYPVLVSDATISGSDLYTGTDIKTIKHSLNTQLSTDHNLLKGEDGPVRQ